jgi:hypothetical protein
MYIRCLQNIKLQWQQLCLRFVQVCLINKILYGTPGLMASSRADTTGEHGRHRESNLFSHAVQPQEYAMHFGMLAEVQAVVFASDIRPNICRSNQVFFRRELL